MAMAQVASGQSMKCQVTLSLAIERVLTERMGSQSPSPCRRYGDSLYCVARLVKSHNLCRVTMTLATG